MNRLIMGLLVLTLVLGSVSFVNQMRTGVALGETCVFGSPCCKTEADIDWSTGFAK